LPFEFLFCCWYSVGRVNCGFLVVGGAKGEEKRDFSEAENIKNAMCVEKVMRGNAKLYPNTGIDGS
jgi:hypothetical protein